MACFFDSKTVFRYFFVVNMLYENMLSTYVPIITRINDEPLYDIMVNEEKINKLVNAGGAVGREIYEKMLCAKGETFEFNDAWELFGDASDMSALDVAAKEFAMRYSIITTMTGMNKQNGGVYYWDYKHLPKCGDTYVKSIIAGIGIEEPTVEWIIGDYWAPCDPDKIRAKFRQQATVTAFAAVNHATPLYGECLGAKELCILKAATNALEETLFNKIHKGHPLIFGQAPGGGGRSVNMYLRRVRDICTFVPGDFAYFKNTDDYVTYSNGPWRGENSFYMGNSLFSGLGVSPKTADQMREVLRVEYNKVCPPGKELNWLAAQTAIKITQRSRIKTGIQMEGKQ